MDCVLYGCRENRMDRVLFVMASAIFFWMPAAFCLHYFFPHSGPFLMVISMVLAGVVTFIGTTLHLSSVIHKDRNNFYLGVPFYTAIMLIVALGLFIILTDKPFLSDPINVTETVLIIVLALLAPFSVALFYSIPKKGSVTQVSTILSLAVSIFALFTILFVLRDLVSSRPTIHAMLGLLGLYWYVGMPVIGICCIANAISGRSRQPSH